MSDTPRKNILILEPDRDTGELLARALETKQSCKCYLASTEEEAVDLLRDIPFDLLITDLSVAMGGDFSALKRLKRFAPRTAILVNAYLYQLHHVGRALALGVRGHVVKPIKIEQFRRKVEELTAVS
jgi:DNA-binding NarL/FixJ family response regulator